MCRCVARVFRRLAKNRAAPRRAEESAGERSRPERRRARDAARAPRPRAPRLATSPIPSPPQTRPLDLATPPLSPRERVSSADGSRLSARPRARAIPNPTERARLARTHRARARPARHLPRARAGSYLARAGFFVSRASARARAPGSRSRLSPRREHDASSAPRPARPPAPRARRVHTPRAPRRARALIRADARVPRETTLSRRGPHGPRARPPPPPARRPATIPTPRPRRARSETSARANISSDEHPLARAPRPTFASRLSGPDVARAAGADMRARPAGRLRGPRASAALGRAGSRRRCRDEAAGARRGLLHVSPSHAALTAQPSRFARALGRACLLGRKITMLRPSAHAPTSANLSLTPRATTQFRESAPAGAAVDVAANYRGTAAETGGTRRGRHGTRVATLVAALASYITHMRSRSQNAQSKASRACARRVGSSSHRHGRFTTTPISRLRVRHPEVTHLLFSRSSGGRTARYSWEQGGASSLPRTSAVADLGETVTIPGFPRPWAALS